MHSTRHALRALTSGRRWASTLFDKVWKDHVVDSADGGSLIYIDRHLVHEVTSPQAFEGLKTKGRDVRRKDLTLVTEDHNIPTSKGRTLRPIANAESRLQCQTLKENAEHFKMEFWGMSDKRQGIVHIIGPEQGFTLPGMTVVCGDSHTSTHGAFGSLAFGIGTSEVEHVLATQTLPQNPAKNMLVKVSGELPVGCTAKDVALHIIGVIGTGGGTGHVIEYAGDCITGLTMEGRMTLCNMAIESGARAGMIAPDATTFDYLKTRPMSPRGEVWEKAVAYWSTLKSDDGATYNREVHIDAKDIAPQVTWGTSPEDVISVTGHVPKVEDATSAAQTEAMTAALKYMGLQGGQAIEGIPVDKVFIGSCTNGRIEDLRAVAEVVKGHKVASNVRHALVVPGSGLVKEQAEKEGIADVIIEAGLDWREPGCSMCLGMNDDRLSPEERCISTSNRNFEGRQGARGRTHLASPAMAAAAAITGTITDVRKFQQRRGYCTAAAATTIGMSEFTVLKGIAAPLSRINIDTDIIIPKQHLKTIKRTGLGKFCMEPIRYLPDGSPDPEFVLNNPKWASASMMVVGDNFGCGSSREHAPWALLDQGIKCLISTSFADIFYNNCFKNGMLPIVLPEAERDVLMADAEACLEFTVDLPAQTITRSNGEVITFEVDEFRKHCLVNGLDDIQLTLQKEDKIAAYEARKAIETPWLSIEGRSRARTA
eukprot:TRINITY_DN7100_c0_g1_i1.p1 TRINITY_DN7100_c0_g1~~TRINITY_DN7100_c0_g1_i1.p1  ORF type:complete len:726 (+),score=305.81 TRINITY_DN7100_c0_g1_i1:51-2180(+)